MTKRLLWAVALAAGIGLAGCGDDDDDDGGAPAPPPATCTPPTAPTATFSAAVRPIPHDEVRRLSRHLLRQLDAGDGLRRREVSRERHDPASSVLLTKGDGQVAHGGADQLDPAQVTSITTWIVECAQDN